MTPKIEIKTAKNGQFYVRLVASNSRVLATTEMYIRLASAGDAARRMQQVVPFAKIIDKTSGKKV